jgi:hypothetical protein
VSRNSGDGGSLRRSSSLSVGRKGLHLLMALAQIEDFNTCRGVDLVHRIARRSTRFTIEIVTLHKHRVIAQASQPNVAFAPQIQLNTFSNVQAVCGVEQQLLEQC